MKIEKLNENKVQFTFNKEFLEENNINMQQFMSNSIESQSLFLKLLNEAENEVGFFTDNYKLSIEAIALANGYFIITITRIEKENLKSVHVHAKRKKIHSNSHTQIFKFNNFDDLCNFENFIKVSKKLGNLYDSSSNLLYKHNNAFYLILNNENQEYILKIANIISEFGKPLNFNLILVNKIKEYGLLIRESSPSII